MEKPVALQLKPVHGGRAYQEVVEQIRQEIIAGRLRVGDRLPGERQLSEMLGVSRASVREAMRVLESLSIVRARAGTGRDSGSVVVAEAPDMFAAALVMHTALDKLSLDEVVDVRCMLEAYAVRGAARNASPEQLRRLEDILLLMEEPGGAEPRRFLELDTEFHLAIAAASGNRLLAYLMSSIRQVLQNILGRIFTPDLADWPSMRADVMGEHRAIYDAIRRCDGGAAAKLVRDHVLASDDRLRAGRSGKP